MTSQDDDLYSDDIPKQFYVIREMTCANCSSTFNAPTPRYQRLRLKESHENLRAEYEGTEPVFYEVIHCPHCGYTRLKNNFDKLNDLQRKLYRDEVGNKFRNRNKDIVVDVDKALENYKFGLITAKSMELPASEVAILFYKVSWLQQITGDASGYINSVAKSYVWLEKALAEESFPVQNIDEVTAEYLMSVFAKDFGDYTCSLKHIGVVLTSSTASDRLKNRARDLKDVVVKLKEQYPEGKNNLEEIFENEKNLKGIIEGKNKRVHNYQPGQSKS